MAEVPPRKLFLYADSVEAGKRRGLTTKGWSDLLITRAVRTLARIACVIRGLWRDEI